jgi:hypothetical protein
VTLLVYPLTVQADEVLLPFDAPAEDPVVDVPKSDMALFDELPVKESEVTTVSRVFWNAKSIQDSVRSQLPENVQSRFTPADGCDIQSVVKTESSVDTCDLNEDPEKSAKYIYSFSVRCSFGSYQVSVCSRQTAQLLNQLKVTSPEKLVSDENPFDLDSTM